MIGFTQQMMGTEEKLPNFYGPANMCFDGAYLWVGMRGTFGFDDDPRNKKLYVIDPRHEPPRLVTTIDLSAFTFDVVRNVRLSNNGLYIYVCLSVDIGGPPALTGRVLIYNKSTFALIGNAQITNAAIGGSVGQGPRRGGKAVDAIDDGADHLWVTNSNTFSGNAMERFSLAAVLANGVSPTTSLQIIQFVTPGVSLNGPGPHAEDLCLGAGFIWTSGGAYSDVVIRVNPTSGVFSTYSATAGVDTIYGLSFLAGALWGGDFGDGVFRMNPAAFGTGSFVTDHVTDITNGGSSTALNAFAYDGTYVWACSASNTPVARRVYATKLTTTGGSVSIAASVPINVSPSANVTGPNTLVFDGTYIWGGMRFERLEPQVNGVSRVGNLFKVSITPGSEKQILRWPTGGTI